MICTSPLEHMPLDTAPMGNLDWERGKRLWAIWTVGFGQPPCRHTVSLEFRNVSLLGQLVLI